MLATLEKPTTKPRRQFRDPRPEDLTDLTPEASKRLARILEEYDQSRRDADISEIRRLHAGISQRKEEMQKADADNLSDAKVLGERLFKKKKEVGHGNFEDWVDANLNFKHRQASNYIRIYSEWDRLQEIGNAVTGLRAALALLREDKKAKTKGNGVSSASPSNLPQKPKSRKTASSPPWPQFTDEQLEKQKALRTKVLELYGELPSAEDIYLAGLQALVEKGSQHAPH